MEKIFDDPADTMKGQIGITQQLQAILREGDQVEDFTVVDIYGVKFTLSEALKAGPLVLKFYRGGWCPYCNLELIAYQNSLAEFARRGVKLLALSPELLQEATLTASNNRLSFPIATDEDLVIAKKLGIVVNLDRGLRDMYREFNHPLAKRNGTDHWELPLPATYVIDQERRIRYAFINFDYRTRVSPEDLLQEIRIMRF